MLFFAFFGVFSDDFGFYYSHPPTSRLTIIFLAFIKNHLGITICLPKFVTELIMGNLS